MHTAKWLEVLQRFEDSGLMSWSKNGQNFKFNATDDTLPVLLQHISGRKISLPSIKKNMTLYGFKISNRSRLEFHNPSYTEHSKDVEGLTRAVQLKNKQDNDRKKTKKNEKMKKNGKIKENENSSGIIDLELSNLMLSSKLLSNSLQNSSIKSGNIGKETLKCETENLSVLMVDEDQVSNCGWEVTQNSKSNGQIQLQLASSGKIDFTDELKILLSKYSAQLQSQFYQQGLMAGLKLNFSNNSQKNNFSLNK